MSPKLRVASVLLTIALIVSGGLLAKTQAAGAQGDASGNAACDSSSPCLTESNSGSGNGINSASSTGDGLIGTTDALGTKSTNGGSGLFGEDLRTSSGHGLFNFGVSGTSTNGTGVRGTGAVGVSATTNSSTGTGLVVTAPSSSLSTQLMKGVGYNGITVFSLDSVGNAVFGDASIGAGGGVTVRGYSRNQIPLFTAANEGGTIFSVLSNGFTSITGSLGINPPGALYADTISTFDADAINIENGSLNANETLSSSDDGFSNTNYTATDSTGVTWLYQGYSTNAGKYTVEMGDSGSVYARIFITMDAPKIAQQTSTGSRVDTYTPQVTEPSLEDFGDAQLNDGVATVRLDPRFAAAMDSTTRYFVTLTPEGDCRGLYVAQRDATSFVVRELQGGQSSIEFTYRIVAKPLGNNAARLAPSTLPYGFDHAVPAPVIHRPTHVVKPRTPQSFTQ